MVNGLGWPPDDDRHAILLCQKLLSFLPNNNLEDPPRIDGDPNVDPDLALDNIIPTDGKKAYDVRDVITRVVDYADFLEVQHFGTGYLSQLTQPQAEADA